MNSWTEFPHGARLAIPRAIASLIVKTKLPADVASRTTTMPPRCLE